MTARIAGFVSRAEAGLRAPKSFSSNITPASGGVAVHYGGPRQPAADPGSDHARCVSTWRAWQNYHMNTQGWSDIAYTGGFCQHGFAFAGRGARVRTAANGTNAGNQSFYAVTWIGGEGQTPSAEALDAADWWITELRRAGGAGKAVRPHRFFKSTGCPGDPLVGYAGSRHNVDDLGAPPPAPAPAPAPTPAPTPAPAHAPAPAHGPRLTVDGDFGPATKKALQSSLNATGARPKLVVDGDFGPATKKALQARLNHVAGPVAVDGAFGPRSTKALQRHVGVTQDGAWGPNTTKALQRKLNTGTF